MEPVANVNAVFLSIRNSRPKTTRITKNTKTGTHLCEFVQWTLEEQHSKNLNHRIRAGSIHCFPWSFGARGILSTSLQVRFPTGCLPHPDRALHPETTGSIRLSPEKKARRDTWL